MPELENYLKPLIDKNSQLVTRYIKNWAGCAKFQARSSHLLLCRLKGNRSELPNFSYTRPLPLTPHPYSLTIQNPQNHMPSECPMTGNRFQFEIQFVPSVK